MSEVNWDDADADLATDIQAAIAGLADLPYYPEPVYAPKPAGVQKGYFVLRYGDSREAQIADGVLLHDGGGNAVGQIDQETWRHVTIVEGE